jgi:RimJ/RimL family protein N-acetyltransferase
LSYSLISEPSAGIAQWVAERVDKPTGFGPCRTFGIEEDGVPVAGVVFHAYDPAAGVIEVSMASEDPRWLSRTIIRKIGEFVFGLCECQLLVARTSARNLRARGFARRAGFTEYVIPRLRGVDEAESVMTLARETWSAHKLARLGRGKG